jgi:4-amino-4-deoxy-L-arabinose transferase-like glycosyltransferase
MDVGGAIVAATAVYAAGLSTWLAVQQWRNQRVRISVSVALGVVRMIRDNPPSTRFFAAIPGELPAEHIVIIGVNSGQREVTLGAVGLILPNGQYFAPDNLPTSAPLPYRLASGAGCDTWTGVHDFARLLLNHGFTGKIRLIGYYGDQSGHLYRAKPFEFDVDAWAAQGDPAH